MKHPDAVAYAAIVRQRHHLSVLVLDVDAWDVAWFTPWFPWQNPDALFLTLRKVFPGVRMLSYAALMDRRNAVSDTEIVLWAGRCSL